MRAAEQAVVSRSSDAIHAEQQLEQQAETILFSQGSLYAVIGMLTLAVLFCAGVLAYSVRRNDLLKSEYRRVMEAFVMRRSKTTSFPTEPEPTETAETMGPAPKLDDGTQDAILLLLTRKPISNIQHPNVNKPRTRKPTPPPASSTVFDDDLDSGSEELPELPELETSPTVTLTKSSAEAGPVSEVAWTWSTNSSDYDRNNTQLDAENDTDDDSDDEDA
ncbi:hypothetical protein HPB52_018644 [Rhipicephalus sanguineus]|uniref:Uncharacterized protein n=1 Tax=Rhipicephalus sanguineus TaxID=34632 RepID=A0A9D4PP39_RHISA|nr:hypothetical protein HPB52_018644 [Rhipicephalus sanguineus]